MATTKNPLIRYKILDQCFRNPGRRFFIDDLISECSKVINEIDPKHFGVSRRQILDDISFMESSEGWNINLTRYRLGRKFFYRYTDISYSINNMPLNGVEINQLKSAIQILNQFNGMPQFEWMNELLPKLQQDISSNEKKPLMAFDSNQYLKGIENLGQLFNAINYEIPLEINYKDFKTEQPYLVILHPYHLKQYNNRWFLLGYNPEKNKYDWNLAIDRIVDIKEINVKYIKSAIFDWDEYFEDIIGVTKPENGEVENIRLLFFGETGKYILNKPIHGSQKAKWSSKTELTIDLSLIVNYELIRLILSYADTVKVISPLVLNEIIKNRLSNALKLYE